GLFSMDVPEQRGEPTFHLNFDPAGMERKPWDGGLFLLAQAYYDARQLPHIERLAQQRLPAEVRLVPVRFARRGPADEDHAPCDLWDLLAHPVPEGDAAAAAEPQVEQDHVRGGAVDRLDELLLRLPQGIQVAHLHAGALQEPPDGVTDGVVVVHHQDA